MPLLKVISARMLDGIAHLANGMTHAGSWEKYLALMWSAPYFPCACVSTESLRLPIGTQSEASLNEHLCNAP